MSIRFEFQGGFKDGDVEIDAAAWRYLFLSDDGQIGKQFREHEPKPPVAFTGSSLDSLLDLLTPEALERRMTLIKNLRCHVYEVIERDEQPNETVIRVRFIGECSQKLSALDTGGDVELSVSMYFSGDRPNASDKVAFHAMISQLKLRKHLRDVNFSYGSCTDDADSLDDWNFLHASGWCKAEAIAREQIAKAAQEFLPDVKFTIDRAPDDFAEETDPE